MLVNKQLLAILACPKCHAKVRLDEKQSGLICDSCKLLFEIKNGIPVMLLEEAKILEDA